MDIKKFNMDIEEFRKLGFLQEVNRKFFHPLGLALSVIIKDDDIEYLGEIWEYREDAEGNFFGDGVIKQSSIDYVEELRKSKIKTRVSNQKEYNVKVDKNGVQVI